jgi:hypothetical protein
MAKIPSITLKPCDSSQIHAYGHCPETNVLEIQFKSKGGPGARYRYQGVDAKTFKEFSSAESKGKFFGERIKERAFPFEKQADE